MWSAALIALQRTQTVKLLKLLAILLSYCFKSVTANFPFGPVKKPYTAFDFTSHDFLNYKEYRFREQKKVQSQKNYDGDLVNWTKMYEITMKKNEHLKIFNLQDYIFTAKKITYKTGSQPKTMHFGSRH